MKYTLLDLTQTILSSLDSDEINSIGDTTEAQQVVKIIRTVYFDIVARAQLAEHKQPFTLDASTDNDYPVLMTRPDNVKKIEWIRYNYFTDSTDDFRYVTIIPQQQFFDTIHQFKTSESNVNTFNLNGVDYYYRTDKNPQYCTVIDDIYVIFDSYDVSLDTTLQSSKTLCYGEVLPTFISSDTFIPDLDDAQFPLLLNEAKALAFLELKQTAHEQAVQQSKRLWRNLNKTKSLIDKPSSFDALPNFGRRC